jgi:MFS family permease
MIYVVGALGSAFSQTATELIVARFVLGIAVGTASFVSPMYISELAPKRIRGGVTSFNQLMVVCGIFVAYIFIVSSFFLSLTTAISREGAFWVYAGFGVAALIYFIAHVPETKDRTLEQIEQELTTSA